jgi:hypothetical protein
MVKLAADKHSSLLGASVSYEENGALRIYLITLAQFWVEPIRVGLEKSRLLDLTTNIRLG